MKLIRETPTMFEFGLGEVTRWTRQKLTWASKSLTLRGWDGVARNLFIPTEDDLKNFPGVEYRLQLTSNRPQSDPLFISVPCRIKPGTKTVLQIFTDEDSQPTECRIANFFNW